MTRSQFILACTLLVVAGTIAFTVTFRQQEEERMTEALEKKTAAPPSSGTKISTRPSSTATRPRTTDRTNYEVTVSELAQREDAGIIEREINAKLEKMSARYELTGNQRRQIYPLLAKYHPRFEQGMVVNGQALSAPLPDEQLSNEIYPLLEGLQQGTYVDDLLAEDQWWGEIITQLRDDLDQALESGEMVTAPEITPAPGDGELIEDSSGGLNLGQ